MAEKVIVFKDSKSREIHTFVSVNGHGARMDVREFISRIVDIYGSPALTFTRKALLDGMLAATDKTIFEMKSQTKEVAALNVTA